MVDETYLTSEYLSFSSGYVDTYIASDNLLAYDGTIWGSSESDFEKISSEPYSIVNGMLVVSDSEWGEISVKEDFMTIGEGQYMKIDKFDDKGQVISVDDQVTCDYRAQKLTIQYTVSIPLENAELIFSTESDWLKLSSLSDKEICLEVNENNTGGDRDAVVVLSYPGASSVNVTISQNYSESEITTDPGNLSCDYKGGEFSFSYTVENPKEGQIMKISTEIEWIAGLTDNEGNVSFVIQENNSGSDREGKILLEYGDCRKEFIVSQSYSVPIINVSQSSVNCDCLGGNYFFTYNINNPRENEELNVTGGDTWLSNIMVVSNTVTFDAAANTDVFPRETKLRLTYMSVTREITIKQGGNLSLATDLSSSGTANCYIVSASGLYRFPAVKGNSDQSVGTVSSVEVLWESYGTDIVPQEGALISYVSCYDNILFFMTSSDFTLGNAVIAAKDAYGKILWSWHIWLTYKPDDQVYNNPPVQ